MSVEVTCLLNLFRPVGQPVQGPVQWSRLVALALAHGLESWAVRSVPAWEGQGMPLEEVNRLVEASRRTGFSGLRHVQALCRILEQAPSDLELVSWKGPLLSQQVHGNATLRPLMDLDFLVAPGQLPAARHHFIAMGFRPWVEVAPPEIQDKVPLDSHTANYWHPGWQIQVELHDSVCQWRFGMKLPWDLLGREKETLSVLGREFPWFAAPVQGLLLAIHGGKHLWRRLLWVMDFHHWLQSATLSDLEAAEALASRTHCLRYWRLALLVSRQVQETCLPSSLDLPLSLDPVPHRWASRCVSSWEHPEEDWGMRERYAFFMTLRERWRDRWPFLVYLGGTWTRDLTRRFRPSPQGRK